MATAYLALRYFQFDIKDTDYAVCDTEEDGWRFIEKLGETESMNGERPVDRVLPITCSTVDMDIDVMVLKVKGDVKVEATVFTNEWTYEKVIDHVFTELMSNLGNDWMQLTVKDIENDGKPFTFHTNGVDFFHKVLSIKHHDYVGDLYTRM